MRDRIKTSLLCRCDVACPAGNPQPAYKLENMKILMEFPKPKDEEQMANAMPEVERKQVRPTTLGASVCALGCCSWRCQWPYPPTPARPLRKCRHTKNSRRSRYC